MGSETYVMDGTTPAHYQVSAASTMQDPAKAGYYGQPISCDIKPRLTKEQHDILEAEFQKQSKPNTNTKKSFADALNVSLDKVNNWFQNRRAKSKQDAKKQAGTYGLYAQQPVNGLVNYDSDTSPSFTSSDYFSMMQQCARDDQLSNGLALGQMHHFQEQTMAHGLPFDRHPNAAAALDPAAMPPHVTQDMFDSAMELNRRTLTQEAFDAFGQAGDMTQSSGHYGSMYTGFPADQEIFQQVFPEMHHDHNKQQDAFVFAPSVGAPLSSNDSSVASTISDHSVFDPSTGLHDPASMSASTSDYADSRSSSCSGTQSVESYYGQVQVPQSQALNHSSQWQPGQSVPVDPSALHQHFHEVEQRQMMQQQPQQTEQPLAWPADEAYGRSDAQNGNMLAQQMSNFAIQAPQPPQDATFKTPAPPTSIAARRQRPRPAQLGLASLRSQSYNSSQGPHSPGHLQQTLSPGQTLRRIRSSNVINGVANGRVMKSVSGTAQRSPLGFTFADNLNSPKAIRHASSSSMGNLAPPTPLSPHDVQSQDQQQQAAARSSFQSWQSSANQLSRQVSISETDAEHDLSFLPPGSALSQQNFTSPPQTPMFHQHPQQQQPSQQQQFLHGSLSNNVMVENTPPQSAPAAQQTFPSSIFMAPPQYPQAAIQSQAQTQGQQAPPMQAMVPSQPQQFMSVSVPEQQPQYRPAAVTFAPSSQYVVPSTTATCASPEAARFSFANGVPVVNAQGQLVMAFPPPQMAQVPSAAATAAPMQFVQHAPPPKSMPQDHTPPQTHYNFITTDGVSPHMSSTSTKPAAPPAELFVHEYSPPQEVKNNNNNNSSGTPSRKALDSGFKNYTFANQGPEHFERTKKGVDSKAGSIASSSPASSSTS